MEKTGSDFDGKRSEKANEACKESDWTSLLFFFSVLYFYEPLQMTTSPESCPGTL